MLFTLLVNLYSFSTHAQGYIFELIVEKSKLSIWLLTNEFFLENEIEEMKLWDTKYG